MSEEKDIEELNETESEMDVDIPTFGNSKEDADEVMDNVPTDDIDASDDGGDIPPTDDDEDDEEEEEEKPKEKKKSEWIKRILLIIIIILLLLLGSCGIMWRKAKDACDGTPSTPTPLVIDKNQGDYSAEEVAVDHSKMVSLPGWGAFNIPANTLTVTKGFEFHNPSSNEWYEDTVTINDIEVESFIVDSNEVEIDHLLRLAGIENTMKNVSSYDENYFSVYVSSDNKWVIKGVAGFDGTQDVVVETADGEEVTLSITSKRDFYYMTFGLYLGTPDKAEEAVLLYQSNLVEPGKYIQRMDMTKALSAGSYDAFVLCQPYESDGATRTNNGVVVLTLNVK